VLLGGCGGGSDEEAARASCVEGFLAHADNADIRASDDTARLAVQLAEPEEMAEVCWVSIRAVVGECSFFERRRTQQTPDAGFSCAAGSPTTAHWTDFELSAARD
jgi:hypothetical protein